MKINDWQFTLATDLKSGMIIVVGIDPLGNYHPWSVKASRAATLGGQDCGCGRCHNCRILAAYRSLSVEAFKLPLEFRSESWWQETSAIRKGAISL